MSSNRQSTIDNQDEKVVEHFGREWHDFTNDTRPEYDLDKEFNQYFRIFPWEKIDRNAEGFDAGCGNGRWAWYVAPKVGKLNCIEPSSALEVAKQKLKSFSNVAFYNTTIDHMPLADNSQDFGYCLGVLHHIPNTEKAMQDCVNKLKSGAPFLVYLYYNFENRPWWFRFIWKCSDLLRRCICCLPHLLKRCITDSIALFVYWPLAKLSQILEKCSFNVKHIPLSAHRGGSFYNMRNCALDRFGTCLEKRFSKADIVQMMTRCGLHNISFSTDPDINWCVIAYKKDN
ncbi:MAG: class I SAM-dependent methyltransferase [Puniceicoccales bacterium]|nr:class I SAM-dependent methyltransferase [Puniceicoccales bacterium]